MWPETLRVTCSKMWKKIKERVSPGGTKGKNLATA